MIDHPKSIEKVPSIYGQIEILELSSNLNVMAKRDQLGYHIPEIFHQVILSGKNLSGQNFTKVDIRFREQKNIVTNPVGSGDTVIIDMQKTDYGFFDALLKKTIESQNKERKSLILEYSSSPNKYELNVTFLIR